MAIVKNKIHPITKRRSGKLAGTCFLAKTNY
jgi:hypothetical protein